MYYLDEFHVLVLSVHQDFCDVKGGKYMDFQWTIVSWPLNSKKSQEVENCSIQIHRNGKVFYHDTSPLHLSESKHTFLQMLAPLTTVPQRCLFCWLSIDEEICLPKMISPFLWSPRYRMLWSIKIQLPGFNQGHFYKSSWPQNQQGDQLKGLCCHHPEAQLLPTNPALLSLPRSWS